MLAADAGDGSVEPSVVAAADQPCLAHRAVQLLNAPATWSVDDVIAAVGDFMLTLGVPASANAALCFPRLRQPDPLRDEEWRVVPASGAVAGLIAASDLAHGVWKATAEWQAAFAGPVEPTLALTAQDVDRINPWGVNSLRTFPGSGTPA